MDGPGLAVRLTLVAHVVPARQNNASASRVPFGQRHEGLIAAVTLVSHSPFSPCRGRRWSRRAGNEGVFALPFVPAQRAIRSDSLAHRADHSPSSAIIPNRTVGPLGL